MCKIKVLIVSTSFVSLNQLFIQYINTSVIPETVQFKVLHV